MRGRLSGGLGSVFCLATLAYGESLISQIGWKGATPQVIIGLVLVGVAVVSVLAGFHFHKVLRTKIDSAEASGTIFAQTAERLDLTETEERRVRELLRHERTFQPQVIFQSVSLFERCVEAEVKVLSAKGLSPDDLQVEENLLSSIRRKLGYNFIPFEHPLASTRNISVGQAGSVFGKSTRTPIIQRALVTQNTEFGLRLEYDSSKEEVYNIASGNVVKFAFTRQHDGVYGISLRVVNADGSSIETEHTLDLRRNQLRQFVRIEIGIPMKFRLLKTADIDKSEVRRDEIVECRMADLGGGGLSFLCDRSLKPGDVVSLTYKLPAGSFGGVAGKIVRVSLQEGKTATYYRHHVQFTNIEPSKREKIVKYVFEKQRQVNQWR